MKVSFRLRLAFCTALLVFVAGATYACKDFLATTQYGRLDEWTLASPEGAEGTLIAAYRVLDCIRWAPGTSAASNWVWGSVTSDDAYKGAEAADQPSISDVEMYNWATGGAEDYLHDKWQHSYEG